MRLTGRERLPSRVSGALNGEGRCVEGTWLVLAVGLTGSRHGFDLSAFSWEDHTILERLPWPRHIYVQSDRGRAGRTAHGRYDGICTLFDALEDALKLSR